jgi:glycosyltransferase involved in cell wall biosynthesis
MALGDVVHGRDARAAPHADHAAALLVVRGPALGAADVQDVLALAERGQLGRGLAHHQENDGDGPGSRVGVREHLEAAGRERRRVAPGRSILVPTAHDEPAIHLDLYREVFSRPAAIAYNTEVERSFLTSRFSIRALVEETVGCGVDLPPGGASSPHHGGTGSVFRRRHRLHGPFLLYGGRIEKGKGCEELLEYFQAYVREGGEASLVLMGVKLMPLPEDPRVNFAGLLSERERLQALEAATVVVVPSPFESLSLLALEAFAVGTPILANARSEVLVDHCVRSHAGLFYADRDEFVECAKLLVADAQLRAAMGRNGGEYIRRHYRWDVIIGKYERMIAAVTQAA